MGRWKFTEIVSLNYITVTCKYPTVVRCCKFSQKRNREKLKKQSFDSSFTNFNSTIMLRRKTCPFRILNHRHSFDPCLSRGQRASPELRRRVSTATPIRNRREDRLREARGAPRRLSTCPAFDVTINLRISMRREYWRSLARVRGQPYRPY